MLGAFILQVRDDLHNQPVPPRQHQQLRESRVIQCVTVIGWVQADAGHLMRFGALLQVAFPSG